MNAGTTTSTTNQQTNAALRERCDELLALRETDPAAFAAAIRGDPRLRVAVSIHEHARRIADRRKDTQA